MIECDVCGKLVDDWGVPPDPCRCEPVNPKSLERDQLTVFAKGVREEHNPSYQQGHNYNRCALCDFTRHPCDPYILADDILKFFES
jgi:hypothetical protein